MNKEFELDENGNVKDKTTFGDVMRVLGKVSYQKPKPKEPFIPKHGVLFVDILEKGCYDCPCCDNEQCYCTVLPDGPECSFIERLPECPIKEITVTPEVFAERMARIQEKYTSIYDTDERHIAMDNLMCELLRELGYGEGVDIFEKAEKWYE